MGQFKILRAFIHYCTVFWVSPVELFLRKSVIFLGTWAHSFEKNYTRVCVSKRGSVCMWERERVRACVCERVCVGGGCRGAYTNRPTSLFSSQDAPKFRSAPRKNSPKSSALLPQDCTELRESGEKFQRERTALTPALTVSGMACEGNAPPAEPHMWANRSPVTWFDFHGRGDSVQSASGRHVNTSVLSPRHDGVRAGTGLDLAQRSRAQRGTLGRAETRQTEAVRAAKVGKWPRGTSLSQAYPGLFTKLTQIIHNSCIGSPCLSALALVHSPKVFLSLLIFSPWSLL